MKLKPIQFIPALTWFIIANILFLIPGDDLPSSGFLEKIHFDKWVHIGLFAGLTFLTALPFIQSQQCSKKLLTKIIIAFIIYGVFIEFLQKYIAYDRSFDVTDMIADAVGCVMGFYISRWLIQRLTKKNKPL
jgi:VanZ family protein